MQNEEIEEIEAEETLGESLEKPKKPRTEKQIQAF
jgi:hypothetical protein